MIISSGPLLNKARARAHGISQIARSTTACLDLRLLLTLQIDWHSATPRHLRGPQDWGAARQPKSPKVLVPKNAGEVSYYNLEKQTPATRPVSFWGGRDEREGP